MAAVLHCSNCVRSFLAVIIVGRQRCATVSNVSSRQVPASSESGLIIASKSLNNSCNHASLFPIARWFVCTPLPLSTLVPSSPVHSHQQLMPPPPHLHWPVATWLIFAISGWTLVRSARRPAPPYFELCFLLWFWQPSWCGNAGPPHKFTISN